MQLVGAFLECVRVKALWRVKRPENGGGLAIVWQGRVRLVVARVFEQGIGLQAFCGWDCTARVWMVTMVVVIIVQVKVWL